MTSCARYLGDRGYRTFGQLGSLSSQQRKELELEVSANSRPTLHKYFAAAKTAREGLRSADECVVGFLKDGSIIQESTDLESVSSFSIPVQEFPVIEPTPPVAQDDSSIEVEISVADDLEAQLEFLKIDSVSAYNVDGLSLTITLMVPESMSNDKFTHMVQILQQGCTKIPSSFVIKREHEVEARDLGSLSPRRPQSFVTWLCCHILCMPCSKERI